MLLLLLVWLIIYIIASVSGFILLRALRMGDCHRVSQTETVLTGLIGLIGITQITSVFWPTDYRMAGLWLIAVCLLNWRLSRSAAADGGSEIAPGCSVSPRLAGERNHYCCLVQANPTIMTAGYITSRPSDGMSSFRPYLVWGNLHGRLAFNSSFFVLSAAFGLTNLVGQTLFTLNGFTLIIFCTYLIGHIHRPTTLPSFRILLSFLLALVLYYLLPPVSSPTPDIWATLLPVFIFLFWLDDLPTVGETSVLFTKRTGIALPDG